jgi:ribosomal protein S21
MQAMVNIEVTKGSSENNLSVLRRFTKRVQSSGVLPRVRSKRYTQRTPSRNTRRAKQINHIKKKEITAELIKLGKITEVSKFKRRR